MIDQKDFNLLAYNTFGIDAKCARYIEVSSEAEAETVLPMVADKPFMIIGGGSNLLLTRDYEGIVLRSAIRGITVTEDDHSALVSVGSGEVWDDVVDYCVRHHYYGAENLSIIPGEAGASAVQNIGAYGVEAKDIIQSIEAVEISSGQHIVIDAAECQYAYRQSRFKGEWKNRFFITRVTYKLSKTFTPHLDYGGIRAALAERGISEPTAQQLRDVIIDIRNAKLPDPKTLGNGGSFFMNPVIETAHYEHLKETFPDLPSYTIDAEHVKIPAGWMIDRCGWKGRRLGRAGVHDRQALVLVNCGGATGAEILALCRAIQADVNDKFGITICPEVNIF